MPIDIHGFEVPETPYRQSNAANRYYDTLLQKQHYDYLLRKDKETDDWKKLGLIQDLTDLSKHQTGSDVANALGNQKAGDVFQKYIAAAGTMSPNELAANIQKDMGGLVSSMDGIKTELTNSDNQLMQLKKIYPNIDIASLTRDYRADVLGRHMKTSSDFYNPIEIQPTQLDLSNPRFLSKYLPNTKNLDDAISNPKGLDPSEVLVGNPNENITYKGKMPFWSQPNFSDEDRAKNNGYLKKGTIPRLNIKSENLPSEFMPALKNNPRKMVDYPTYKQFYDEHPLEVEKGAADMFGEHYDKMTDHEKELAQRDFLYTKISALDKNNLYPSASTHPSAAMIKLSQGGGSGGGKATGETNINDVYKEIKNWASSVKDGHGAALNKLSAEAQSVVLKQARDLTGDNDIGQADIYVKYEDDGSLTIKGVKDRNVIGKLNFTGTNLGKQPDVKAKREIVKIGNNQPTETHPSDSYSRSDLKKAGWTDAQIETARKAGKIKVHD